MASFTITGGNKLSGRVQPPGSKNAVLPLLAAGLLFGDRLIIDNLPEISDVSVMIRLLAHLGAQVHRNGETVEICALGPLSNTIPASEAARLRASVLFLGPLLARVGRVFLPLPGGDLIGRRPINMHLDGLRAMGAYVRERPDGYELTGKLSGAEIYLEEASVTATENIMMAATLASGTTVIRHAAQEEHVQVLAETLRSGGVEILGAGTSTILVRGTGGRLLMNQVTVSVPPDELDAGTFAIAALLTDGKITIDPYPERALRAFTSKLLSLGAEIKGLGSGTVTVSRKKRNLAGFTVKVGPAPAFQTDLQPLMTVLGTQATGLSLIHDWMYERRFGYVEQLERFGAKITVCDPHRVLVFGPTPLVAQSIISPDIRAGIAFVLAALTAVGTSTIAHAEIIERGYANLPDRLRAIGAKIQRKDD